MKTRPEGRARKVLCAPYHIYTHQTALDGLFQAMAARGWSVSVLLPFTNAGTLDNMVREAHALRGAGRIHDPTVRRLIDGAGTVGRMLRAVALLAYFVRTAWLLVRWRPDALLLTSDLGGISVRFVQLVCSALGTEIFILQTTLFLKVVERNDLKFSFRPGWLHAILSRGLLKKLFLFFGDVPGTFLQRSYIGVQDDEIRGVCIEFGKRVEFIKVVGSLQAASIRAARVIAGDRTDAGLLPRVLFLSECISERYGPELGQRHIEWMRQCARQLAGRVSFSVRFHPREAESYRAQFVGQLGSACIIDTEPDAVSAASKADVIVGAYSMLMFDAQAAGISTVFLDVGEDPLGFYTDRRVPLARSAGELAKHTWHAILARWGNLVSSAADPNEWAESIVDWIAAVTLRKR